MERELARSVILTMHMSGQPIGHLLDALGVPREWPLLYAELEEFYSGDEVGWDEANKQRDADIIDKIMRG